MTSTIRVGKLKKPVKLQFYYSPGVTELVVDQVGVQIPCLFILR